MESRLEDAEVIRQQLEATFRRASPMHVAMPVLGICSVWALSGLVSPVKLGCWFTLVCLAALNSLRMRWAFGRVTTIEADRVRQWSFDRTLMSAFNGLAIGSAGVLLFVPGNPEAQSLTLLLICGTVAATVMASSGHLPSLIAYLIFTMPPAGLRLIAEGQSAQMAMGGFALVYGIVAAAIGHNYNRLESRAIRLSNENRQLIEELRTASTRLERSNRELEDFAFTVSHDLKNDLVGVRMVLESLANNPSLLEQRISYLAECTEHSMSFVDRVLQLARVGRVIDTRKAVSLAPLLRALFDRLKPADSPAALVLPDDIPTVWGDPGALEQVFANLLSNAVEHRDPEKSHFLLEVSCSCVQGQIEVALRDNGRGIATGDAGRIFDISFTTGKNGHSGFGLAIVKKIVAAHGGAVRAQSAGPGYGAEFVVTLPAA